MSGFPSQWPSKYSHFSIERSASCSIWMGSSVVEAPTSNRFGEHKYAGTAVFDVIRLPSRRCFAYVSQCLYPIGTNY